MIALLLALALAAPAETGVPHPEVPCWTGEPTWTAPGERPSDMLAFSTRDGAEPAVTIEHHRDEFRRGAEVAESYNFLEYRFPSRPGVQARVYRWSNETVQVSVGTATIATLAALRAAAGDEIVCYLQKRFEIIEAPSGDRGFQPVWRARRL
jgi:hypothetical protein